MEVTKEFIDQLYRERVLRARTIPDSQKLMIGPSLFEQVCDRMRWGLRNEHPGADEATIEQKLMQRFARLRQVRGEKP